MTDSVVAEISLFCSGTTTPQREFIWEAANVLKHAELKVEVHALGTNVEGSIDNILVAVKHIRRRCHEMGAGKVEIHLNISSRTDPSSLEERKQKILGKGRQQGIFG